MLFDAAPAFAVCFPALFTDPCARSPRSSSVAVAFSHIFPTPLARARASRRRIRASSPVAFAFERAFAPFQARLVVDRIARPPSPFSLSAPLFRATIAHRSSVFVRPESSPARAVPRVRASPRASRATHRFHPSSFASPSRVAVPRRRPARARRVALARTRFRRRHGRRRLSLRRARHRARRRECGRRRRAVVPP